MDDTVRKQHERRIYDHEENLDRPPLSSYWDQQLYRRMFAYQLDRDVDRMGRRYLGGAKVLVLGASHADVSFVNRYTDRMVALNISRRAIEEIRQAFPDIETRVADAEEALGDERFDAVYCHSILHHLHPLDAVLDRLHQALVPGGRLFVGAEPGLLNPPAALARRLAPSQSHTPGERPFVFTRFHRDLSRRFEPLERRCYFLTSMIWPFLARKQPWSRRLCGGLMTANLAVERALQAVRIFDDLFWILAGVYRRRDGGASSPAKG